MKKDILKQIFDSNYEIFKFNEEIKFNCLSYLIPIYLDKNIVGNFRIVIDEVTTYFIANITENEIYQDGYQIINSDLIDLINLKGFEKSIQEIFEFLRLPDTPHNFKIKPYESKN